MSAGVQTERAKRRGQVVGFIGGDGKTHAADPHLTTYGGDIAISRCEPRVTAEDYQDVPFITNPKHPLCLGCVSAIEDEIRGEKA